MPTWWNQLKDRFQGVSAADRQASAVRVTRFIELIAADDVEAIEAARGEVRPLDIPALIAHYWTLEKAWPQKRALIELLMDQFHDDMRPMMLDFLRAPVVPGDELMELAQAIALGFIDEQYDQYMTYYNDRSRLARDVAAVRAAHGITPEPLPPPPPAKPAAAPEIDRSKSANQRLMDAATAGNLREVRQALHDGANINVVIGSGDYKGCSSLMMALMRQRFEVAHFLIDSGANVNHKRPARHTDDRTRGQTPLWWAANHGHLELARKLLKLGADVNTPDHFGSTPLTVAASSGHLEMVQFLVKAGADVNAQIYDGRKAFNLSITHGHKKVAAYLLSLGGHPDERGSSGHTPLMVAAENNFIEVAQLLIERGADVNAVHPGPGIYAGLRGWTPLVFAVAGGYVRMAKVLIEAGADVHYVVPAGANYTGKPIPARPLIEFATGKRAESLRKLLK